MKEMVVSRGSERADAGWLRREADHAWPEGAGLRRKQPSATAKDLLELEGELCEIPPPEIRGEKVARLREAIARGEYRVSAEVLAEKLLVALFDPPN
jgi:hypothetical protein